MKHRYIRTITVLIMIMTIMLPLSQSVHAWYSGPHAFTLEEYYALVDEGWVPRNIIGYNLLSGFGEFDEFQYYSPDAYWYSFVDENGCEVLLWIRRLGAEYTENYLLPAVTLPPEEERPIDKILSKPDSLSNMAVLGSDEVGTIHLNGLKYRYWYGGELGAIEWVSGNIEFTLTGDFANSPIGEKNTLVSRLLDPSAAQFAAISLKLIPVHNWFHCNLWIILGTIGVAAGVGVFIFLRHRKKKTA